MTPRERDIIFYVLVGIVLVVLMYVLMDYATQEGPKYVD